jgi:GNAT superfamily N-acetyltransferase
MAETMATVTLRPATTDDATAIATLFLASRREALPYLPEVHTDAETFAWMEQVVLARGDVWVAEFDGRIVGFMAVNGDHLDHLYLLPGYQRRGIGDRLLAKAKELSPDRLELWAFQRNAPARAFYEARGFVAVEFGDGSGNEERTPDVRYEWVANRNRGGGTGL